MNTITQHAAAQQQATMDTLVAAQSAMLTGFAKLVDLNLNVVKTTLGEASARARQAVALQDPQQALAFAATLAQSDAALPLTYGKQAFDIVAGVQAELGKLVQTHIADGRAQFDQALDQWARSAPAGSEGAVAAFKATVASANSAYDTLTRAVKEASDAAETNLNAAANATFKAAADVAQASVNGAKAATRSRRAQA